MAVARDGDSRPDAWVYGEDFVIVLESKVAAALDPHQIQRHLHKLRVDALSPPRVIERSWAEVHRFFLDLHARLSGRDAWLVQQWTQYLAWIGMAACTGFEQGIFDYFVAHDDDDTRLWVRDTVDAFAVQIVEALAHVDPFYAAYDLGTLRRADASCWVAFGPPAPVYRQWAHQTISLDASGLAVGVNVELKAATDRMKAALRRHRATFEHLLCAAGEAISFRIEIEERIRRQASLYTYRPMATLASSHLAHPQVGAYGFDYLETLLHHLPLPYVTIRHFLARQTACALSSTQQGRPLVEEMVRVMHTLHPLVRFLNAGDG